MKKRRQADFWRPAWQRLQADPDALRWSDSSLHGLNWAGAIEQATAGDWAQLDQLVQLVIEFDHYEMAPPPALWPALDAFFAAPPDRRRGLKRRVDDDVAASIRGMFHRFTTQPAYVIDADGNVLRAVPPSTKRRALESIARECGLSEETVRNIVEFRGAYRE